MTKELAKEIKKAINAEKRYTTYFNNKTEELRVRVHTYNNFKNENTDEEIKNNICKLLNKIDKAGLRPRYRIDNKTYQGFIHDTLVVFS